MNKFTLPFFLILLISNFVYAQSFTRSGPYLADADALADDVDVAFTTVDNNIANNTADIATVQADVDQNELDSDAADIAIQTDVDLNEVASDLADGIIQADVDQNEADSDLADGIIQADVDQNEADSDAADATLQANIDAVQADVDANEVASATADAALQAAIDNLTDTSDADGDGLVGVVGVAYKDVETGEIRIGENSLITNEVNGVQQLYAEDANEDPIDIDITNGSDLLVGGVSVMDSINNNATDIATNATAISQNSADILENRKGIAMAAAIQHSTLLPGNTQALDFGYATFEGESAMSINYSRQVKQGVQLNLSHASSGGTSINKIGLGFQW
ncbi:MAG: hypothetical protein CML12_02520 [Puniceicoccaceae bacterium]|nr:hypothetical protein [Puniceicoccaceae bacterium]